MKWNPSRRSLGMTLPPKILDAMYSVGALQYKAGIGGKHVFKINFKLVSDHFPTYLKAVIKESVSPETWECYELGYMKYVIAPEGDLWWKQTAKLENLVNGFSQDPPDGTMVS